MSHPAPKTVLISALNWGLGHASRCIPLIDFIIEEGHHVVVAADGAAYDFFKRNLNGPDLRQLSDVSVRIPQKGSVKLSLFRQSLVFFGAMRTEKNNAKRLIEQIKPSLIISDNRYGVRSDEVPSILITHQLRPPLPGLLKPIARSLLEREMKKFDEIWVPDFSTEPNLSGQLSHPSGNMEQVRYIGPLSRFTSPINNSRKNGLLGIISGPEPMRTYLEKELLNCFQSIEGEHVILRGKPSELREENKENVKLLSHLNDQEFQKAINDAELVVASSGYSNIMDLYQLRAPALVFPTPGQAEQEYLALHLNAKFGFHKTTLGSIKDDLKLVVDANQMHKYENNIAHIWQSRLREYLA